MYTLEHSYYEEQVALCLFSLEPSLPYGNRVIYQPVMELFLVCLGHAAPIIARPCNNAFFGQDTNHSKKGLPEFQRSSN